MEVYGVFVSFSICLAEFGEILSAYQNVNLKKSTKMMFYRNRLKTFTSWPFSSEKQDTCSAECMAAAGFYSICKKRNDTSVKCFCCLKELDGWEAMDSPWEEHRRHQSNCTFIMLNKMEPEWMLGDYIELQQRMVIKYLVSTFNTCVFIIIIISFLASYWVRGAI
uniref:Baculoviral IAP repeat-containing protein 5.2-B n=1 Tax=Cacopsylla melanoneura TaxID=428564 RepID=A0A8D9A2C6_9HEMI